MVLEEDNNVMWNELPNIIRRVPKKIIENKKGVHCKPKKVGGGAGRYKKQLRLKGHILKLVKKKKTKKIFRIYLTEKEAKKVASEAKYYAYESLYKKLDKDREIYIYMNQLEQEKRRRGA